MMPRQRSVNLHICRGTGCSCGYGYGCGHVTMVWKPDSGECAEHNIDDAFKLTVGHGLWRGSVDALTRST